ncbi:hypothetical protein M3Y99_01193300 [Aphelenchoides fujianensis]|nr:hypothetical protein M3Y99_01193300 [Aphelenchoides fujianensis]
MLVFFFLLLSSVHPLPTDGAPTAYPCRNGRLMFVVDVSEELKAADFKKQVDFLSNRVFTDEWTALERLTLVQYDQTAWDIPFVDDETAADVRREVRNVVKVSFANLTRLFESIDRWQKEAAAEVVHSIVFVSRIDQATVDAIRPFVQRLQQKNYELTFVAVGAQLDAALFLQLSPNLIQWDVKRQDTPADWRSQFWTAYGCADEPSENMTVEPSVSLSTQSSPTQPTTPAAPSCRNGTFAIMQDTSGKALDIDLYWTSLKFVRYTLYPRIYQEIDHFWWGYYGSADSWMGDFSNDTPAEVNQTLAGYAQNKDDANLIQALTNPELLSLVDAASGQITLVVFVSGMSDDIVKECEPAAAALQAKNVRLVLVAVARYNRPNLELMAKLTRDRDAVQFWDSSRQPEPRNFKRWFDYTVGCPNEEPFVPCADRSGIQINLILQLDHKSVSRAEAEVCFVCSSLSTACRRDVYDVAGYWNDVHGIGYYRQAYVAFAGNLNKWDLDDLRLAKFRFRGPFAIVALNAAVKTAAAEAGYDVIDWSDPTASAPDDWKRAFWAAFGCAGSPPTGV